jgi:L-iditol 2-dehydrogenase
VLPVSTWPDVDFGSLVLVEPLACVLRGSRVCAIAPGDPVLISGAGPIGLLHLRVAQLRAPRTVVVSEPSAERRAQAHTWGADHMVDPAAEDLAGLITVQAPLVQYRLLAAANDCRTRLREM